MIPYDLFSGLQRERLFENYTNDDDASPVAQLEIKSANLIYLVNGLDMFGQRVARGISNRRMIPHFVDLQRLIREAALNNDEIANDLRFYAPCPLSECLAVAKDAGIPTGDAASYAALKGIWATLQGRAHDLQLRRTP